MKLKPQNNYKHVLNFVSKQESRPTLTGIHFTEKGDIEATNSHILIKLYRQVDEGKELLINPKTLKLIQGEYPNVNRLIPKSSGTEFILNQEDIVAIFNFAKSLKKDDVVCMISRNLAKVTLKSSTGIETTLSVGLEKDFTINLRAEYIKIVFDFLRDNTESVTVRFTGENRPILFTDNSTFDTLITPVRVK